MAKAKDTPTIAEQVASKLPEPELSKPPEPQTLPAKTGDAVTRIELPRGFIISLSDIYACIRDGDYLSAFKKAAALLDSVVNPKLAYTANSQTWETVLETDLNAELVRIENFAHEPKTNATPNPATGIGVAEIIAIVELVARIIRQFRHR